MTPTDDHATDHLIDGIRHTTDRLKESDYPSTALVLRLAADEMERLAAWKTDATVVLAAWEDVWVTAGQPGPPGGSKAVAVKAEIERLNAVIAAQDTETDRHIPAPVDARNKEHK